MSQALNSEVLVASLDESPASIPMTATPAKPSKPRVWTVFTTYAVAAVGGVFGIVMANAVLGVIVGVSDAMQWRDNEFIQSPIQQVL